MAKASKKSAAAESAPTLVNGKVAARGRNRKASERRSAGPPGYPLPPPRQTNASRRKREYLIPDEVEQLLQASSKLGRHGARDRTSILLAYRHGLRVSELVSLRWDQVDLRQGLLHVARLKHGIASVHPMRGPELRALRRLQRDYPDTAYVFVSERKAPLTVDAIRKIVNRAGREAGIEF